MFRRILDGFLREEFRHVTGFFFFEFSRRARLHCVGMEKPNTAVWQVLVIPMFPLRDFVQRSQLRLKTHLAITEQAQLVGTDTALPITANIDSNLRDLTDNFRLCHGAPHFLQDC